MNRILWSDFHSNMHSGHLNNIDYWLDFAKDMLDFWAPVYYPYFVNSNQQGFHFEDTLPPETFTSDWQKLNLYLQEHDSQDFPLFAGYEWQGDGTDGDHNVICLGFNQPMLMPMTYTELCRQLEKGKSIAIPHHTGYQPGHRGKNWQTHNEEISPVMEIYSSHGSSETSDAAIPLNVHIHMGPRAESGCALFALRKGIKTGFIASGDNHVCPAISGNGFVGVICDGTSREHLYQAVLNRHTYGVSRSKIQVDYRINNHIMGSETTTTGHDLLELDVVGTSAVDKIEFFRNGVIEDTYVHNGSWERHPYNAKVKFKFELELGWGPDRRVFPDIKEKTWQVALATKGKITNVEKLWTSPGSIIRQPDESRLDATIVTRKEKQGEGKLSQKNYLTPYIQNQSIIVEMEDDINNSITLTVCGETHCIPVKTLLEEAQLFALEDEVKELLATQCGFTSYYREDPWWHNAYKYLIHRASPEKAYTVCIKKELGKLERDEDSIFVKVTQKNGDVAWTSPIWIKEE